MSTKINGKEHASGNVAITRRQADGHRASIRVSCLLTRLENNAMGVLYDPDKNLIEMSVSQVKSAQILLDKALPTLQAIDATIHTDIPEHTPAELKILMSQYVRGLPREEFEDLLAAKPDLHLIEAPFRTGSHTDG